MLISYAPFTVSTIYEPFNHLSLLLGGVVRAVTGTDDDGAGNQGGGSTTTTTMSMRLHTGSRRQKTLTTMARVNHAETNTYIYE